MINTYDDLPEESKFPIKDSEIMKGRERFFPRGIPFSEEVSKFQFYQSMIGGRDDALNERDSYKYSHSESFLYIEGELPNIDDEEEFKSKCLNKLLSMQKNFEDSCIAQFRKDNLEEITTFENAWSDKLRALNHEKYEFENEILMRMRNKYKSQLDELENVIRKHEQD